MHIPFRFVVAAAAAASLAVASFVTVGFFMLAMDSDGNSRAGYLALAFAAAVFVLGVVGGFVGWTAIRHRWIRMLRARRRRDRVISGLSAELARVGRKVDDLPSHRIVGGLDEQIRGLAAMLADVQSSLNGLPDTARLHKIVDVSAASAARDVSHTNALIDRVTTDVTALRQDLESVRREFASEIASQQRRGNQWMTTQNSHLYGQVDGLAALYALLRPNGALPALFEEWAIGADLAAHLVRRVFDRRPSTIVELGSGSSTVILAMACQRVGHGHVLAIEHDPKYATRTADMVAAAGMADWATIALAPLEELPIGDRLYRWYRLEDIDVPEHIDILLVDGPPGATGPEARFPAVPMLRDRLDATSVVFLDDVRRDDEAAIVAQWCEEYGLSHASKIRFTTGTAELVTRSAEGGTRPDGASASPSDSDD